MLKRFSRIPHAATRHAVTDLGGSSLFDRHGHEQGLRAKHPMNEGTYPMTRSLCLALSVVLCSVLFLLQSTEAAPPKQDQHNVKWSKATTALFERASTQPNKGILQGPLSARRLVNQATFPEPLLKYPGKTGVPVRGDMRYPGNQVAFAAPLPPRGDGEVVLTNFTGMAVRSHARPVASLAGCSTCKGLVCIPSPSTFGYNETTWRPWPGQARSGKGTPAASFPQSLGREVLPTPLGRPITESTPRSSVSSGLPGESFSPAPFLPSATEQPGMAPPTMTDPYRGAPSDFFPPPSADSPSTPWFDQPSEPSSPPFDAGLPEPSLSMPSFDTPSADVFPAPPSSSAEPSPTFESTFGPSDPLEMLPGQPGVRSEPFSEAPSLFLADTVPAAEPLITDALLPDAIVSKTGVSQANVAETSVPDMPATDAPQRPTPLQMLARLEITSEATAPEKSMPAEPPVLTSPQGAPPQTTARRALAGPPVVHAPIAISRVVEPLLVGISPPSAIDAEQQTPASLTAAQPEAVAPETTATRLAHRTPTPPRRSTMLAPIATAPATIAPSVVATGPLATMPLERQMPATLGATPMDDVASDTLQMSMFKGPRLTAPATAMSVPVAHVVVSQTVPPVPVVAEIAPAPVRKPPKPLQANWMAALNPGFHGDASRSIIASAPRADHRETHLATTATAQSDRGRPSDVQPVSHTIDAEPAALQRTNAPRADSPPIALDGFCPIELITNESWVAGDAAITTEYRGRTYMFAGRAQRNRFLADPGCFSPVCGGCDPVLAIDGRRHIEGKIEYCVTYHGRLFMFSSPVTLSQFRKQPKAYATVGQ